MTVAIAACGGSGGDGEKLVARSAEPDQVAAFSVLSTEPEEVPEPMRAPMTLMSDERRLGLELGLAQLVRARGIGVWIVPGNGVMCVIRDATNVAGCADTAELARKGMTMPIPEPERPTDKTTNHYIVIGLMPDGVAAMKMIRTRRTVRVPVVDNAFAFEGYSPMKTTSVLERGAR